MYRKWLQVSAGVLLAGAMSALFVRLGDWGQSWDTLTDMLRKPSLNSAGKWAFVITFIIACYKIHQGFKAFGVDPGKLLASLTDKAKLSDLGAQTSFRHRFAQEFEQVTMALQPRTMTVFIDDLDRCEPDQVMQVMQSLNFLSASGECFLVIGMEEDAVTNCVAVSLKEQFASRKGQKLEEQDSLRARWSYARQWMEKLIQIRIPVPNANDEQFKALLTGMRRVTNSGQLVDGNPVLGWLKRAWQTSLPVLPLAGLILFGAAVYFASGLCLDYAKSSGGIKMSMESRPTAEWSTNSFIQPLGLTQVRLNLQEGVMGSMLATNASFPDWISTQKWMVNLEFRPSLPTNSPTKSGVAASNLPTLMESSKVAEPRASHVVAFTITAGQRNYSGWWITFPVLLILLLYAWRKILERINQEFEDSEDFREALRRWSNIIFATAKTPRAAKRLINKLRLYAILSRALKSPESNSFVSEKAVVAFGVNEHRIKGGMVDPADILRTLTNEGLMPRYQTAINGLAGDLADLREAWQLQPEIFTYLSSTIDTEEHSEEKKTV
jgi:hypothetical protein